MSGHPFALLALRALLAFVVFAIACDALAVPSFRRQTGLECTACHLSWPELTAVGRNFKLNGYTLGEARSLPLAAMIQGSYTKTRDVPDAARDALPRDDTLVLQQASLFLAGRLSEHAGVFSQYTYDGVAHHASIDNTDLRLVDSAGEGTGTIVYGLTVNNNPTVQDVWNTTPAWSFPYIGSPVAAAPNAATLIDGGLGQKVAGVGAYLWWRRTVYAELSFYRNASGLFRWFGEGTDTSQPALQGNNPYWRLALSRDWDGNQQSAMVGLYGAQWRPFGPPGAALPADRFSDLGVDAQYQYVTDRHRWSVQATRIREHQSFDASFAAGASSIDTGTLETRRAKASYYFDRAYGISLGLFDTRGDRNDLLFATGDAVTGSADGSPDSRGAILELDWLPRRDIRIGAQYTWYDRFNGARSNYDGNGRNARDNDALLLFVWLMF